MSASALRLPFDTARYDGNQHRSVREVSPCTLVSLLGAGASAGQNGPAYYTRVTMITSTSWTPPTVSSECEDNTTFASSTEGLGVVPLSDRTGKQE